jgi:dCMP deaminase
MKRTDYISWDEYFMGIALLSAQRSKDPGTQVGACIVSPEKRILTVGYNGMPSGCSEDEFPWERTGDPLETKYLFVCHAEMNAILNSGHSDLKGSIVYTTLFPCAECTKAMIQKGIKEVVYLSDKYAGTTCSSAARRMMDSAGVVYRPYQPTGRNST